jgi:pentatricopeptide repeat protein
MELVEKALIAHGKGDHLLAAKIAAAAKDAAPRSGRIRELLGLSHYQAGHYREAIPELNAFKRMTGSLEQNHVVADCYRAIGRPEKALELCGQVKRRDVPPDIWTETLLVAAGTLADEGHIEKALAYLRRGDTEVRSVQPHHLRLWYLEADLLEKSGQPDTAKAVWERIFASDPTFFDVAERVAK